MPHIQQLITSHPEIVEGNLHSISLYALLNQDPTAFERDPSRVFLAIYPSDALKRLLNVCSCRLGNAIPTAKGTSVAAMTLARATCCSPCTTYWRIQIQNVPGWPNTTPTLSFLWKLSLAQPTSTSTSQGE